MPIYKYTLTKYLKAYSTWVIVAISMLLVIVLGGFVPFRFAKINNASEYAVLSVAITAAITSFLGIFTSVFAGFKSATMFKDEVEDGTFLVMLSKPVSRSKIIFYKWLALQTAIIGYTFIVALSYLAAVLIFDNGHKLADLKAFGIKTMRSQIIVISLMIWLILFIISLIFSSISLLLSTRLSVGTTIGISIALGVVIPITSLVGTFTSKPAYKDVSNTNIALLETSMKEQIGQFGKQFEASAGQASPIVKALVDSLESTAKSLPSLTANSNTLYGLGLATNDKDTFKIAQAFDFNYQIQKLSEFASEQATPEAIREHLNFSHAGQSLKTVTNEAIKGNPFTGAQQAQIDKLNEMLVSSWNASQGYREIAGQLFISMVPFMKIDDTKPVATPTALRDGNFIVEKEMTDANKAAVALELQTNWLPVVKKTLDSFSSDKNAQFQNTRAQIGMFNFFTNLVESPNLITLDIPGKTAEENKTMTSMFIQTLNMTRHLFKPIDLWAGIEALEAFQKDQGFDVKEIIKDITEQSGWAQTPFGSIESMMQTSSDAKIYNYIASAVLNGHDLAKIKTIEYTNKFTILWIYLALALALVPVAYLVIRKQDFR